MTSIGCRTYDVIMSCNFWTLHVMKCMLLMIFRCSFNFRNASNEYGPVVCITYGIVAVS